LTACQQDVHRLSTTNSRLAPGVGLDLPDLFVGDDVDQAQEDVARQLLQAAPAREVGLGRAEMQAQFLLAAEDLGGATQRAIVNIVKHSPSPLAGCHFSKLDLVRRAQIASRAARRQSSRAKFFSRPRACWKKVADVFLSCERRIKPL